MILFLNDVLMSFRSCFKRRAAFEWFVITIIGFMVRNDSLGITSIVRELAIKPELYTTYLHYFPFYRMEHSKSNPSLDCIGRSPCACSESKQYGYSYRDGLTACSGRVGEHPECINITRNPRIPVKRNGYGGIYSDL